MGTNLYVYAMHDAVNLADVNGQDVCVVSTNTSYRHRWVEIGGDTQRTYGFYPFTSPFGAPGDVRHPEDPDKISDPSTKRTCHAATPQEDEELEDWIREKFPLNRAPGSPIYFFGLSDCYDFTNTVVDELERRQDDPWHKAQDIFWFFW